MNTALWVLQLVLALLFLGAGTVKVLLPKAKLQPKMAYVEDFSAVQMKLIGLAEISGAVGLVVPCFTHLLPILTPIAAFALAVLMAGAVWTHARRKEPLAFAVVLTALSLAVGLGRLFLAP